MCSFSIQQIPHIRSETWYSENDVSLLDLLQFHVEMSKKKLKFLSENKT